MAPFMIAGNFAKEKLRILALRLQCASDRCVSCGPCDRHCPMSLPVSGMVKSGEMFHQECILFGNCADCCPKSAIRLCVGPEK